MDTLEELEYNCASFAINFQFEKKFYSNISEKELKSLTSFIAQGAEIQTISLIFYKAWIRVDEGAELKLARITTNFFGPLLLAMEDHSLYYPSPAHNIDIDLQLIDIDFSGKESIKALVAALEKWHRVSKLRLSCNKLGNAGITQLANSLLSRNNDALTCLEIFPNDVSDEGVEAIADTLLLKTRTLTSFFLASTVVGSEGVKAIANALTKNRILQKLSLCNNRIRSEGAKIIADALIHNQTLSSLSLNNNPIGIEGAKAIADILAHNHALISLSLNSSSINSEGAKAIADILAHNRALYSLSLDFCLIGDEGTKAIARALTQNRALKNLSLKHNNICNEGIKAVADTLLLKNQTLTCLLLEGNNSGDEGVKAIANALTKNRTLTRLSLRNNSIGTEGAKALANALKLNHALAKLDLYSNVFDDRTRNSLKSDSRVTI